MFTRSGNELVRTRRRFGYALTGAMGAFLVWLALPPIPVLWGPWASESVKAEGRALFVHDWEPHDTLAGGDGLGPVFNARSCAACHFQGGLGGGGGNDHNVLAFEAMPTPDRRWVEGGLIHKYAVFDRVLEDRGDLARLFPSVTTQIDRGCYVQEIEFDPVRTEAINATALFGAGWIDRIPIRAITQRNLSRSFGRVGRELQGEFEGKPVGRFRILPDGRIGKFGWKAQFATLEEFVAAACANEIGLGNPHMTQAKPLGMDDYPDVEVDLDGRQFGALVAFVDTLPKPTRRLPVDPEDRARIERGERLFLEVGCAECHVPDIGGVEGVYSDFLLHRIEARSSIGGGYDLSTHVDAPLPTRHPLVDEWRTPPLWGVADSAPYFHDGGSPTLQAAIVRHRGDAEAITERFDDLTPDDQSALIGFLESLRAPEDAEPIDPPDPTQGFDLAMNR